MRLTVDLLKKQHRLVRCPLTNRKRQRLTFDKCQDWYELAQIDGSDWCHHILIDLIGVDNVPYGMNWHESNI